MTIPADVAYYDTSSFSVIDERLSQYSNRLIPIGHYLKPIELNPLDDKLYYLNQFNNISDNWDGYGAKAPHQNAIKNAIGFLKILPSGYQKLLNIEEVNITPYGTIVMEWFKDDNNYISIEIGSSKIGFFSETPDGENPLAHSLEFTQNEVPHQILPTFKKVYSKA